MTQEINKSVLAFSDVPQINSLTPLKYNWAKRLYDYGNSCIWLPPVVRMQEDVQSYTTASEDDRLAYERTLGYLNAADVAATENVGRAIANKISAPEIEALMCSIAYQETNHASSYLYMLQSLGLDHNKQDEINLMYMTTPAMDAKLQMTNDMCAKLCALPDVDLTDEQITEFVHGYFYFSQIFEGCFFMAGFNPIYSLSRRGAFQNSAKMLNYIRRDEEKLHVNTGVMTIRQILIEHPNVKLDVDRVHTMLLQAFKLESDYIDFVMPNGLIGYNKTDHLRYFRWLSNKACTKFKLPPLYEEGECETPGWLRSETSKVQQNFFEGKVIEYDVNSGVRDSFDP